MKREPAKVVNIVESNQTVEGVRIGRIVGTDERAQFLVDYTGNPCGPIAARSTSSLTAELRKGNAVGKEVLLVFVNNDAGLPIIIDTMYSLIEEIADSSTTDIHAQEQRDATIDGKRISFEAEQEIVLRCGKASITLTRAGKVLIKGDYVLNHSSGENRIRGGSVTIN